MMTGDAAAMQVGLALGLASILSIGPNNITLMREGLVRGRVGLVASLISGSQVVLILASWWLASSLQALDPTLRAVMSWIAVGVLFHFAVQSFRAAGAAPRAIDDQPRVEGPMSCVMRVLPVVWLNPLSYLEFLFLPAAIMEMLEQPQQQLVFLGTVTTMVVASNLLYGFGGRLMSGIARSGQRLRAFDLTSGAVMCCVASLLAVSLTYP
jgi:L-lysine exporter family protein LysE/ArgO